MAASLHKGTLSHNDPRNAWQTFKHELSHVYEGNKSDPHLAGYNNVSSNADEMKNKKQHSLLFREFRANVWATGNIEAAYATTRWAYSDIDRFLMDIVGTMPATRALGLMEKHNMLQTLSRQMPDLSSCSADAIQARSILGLRQ